MIKKTKVFVTGAGGVVGFYVEGILNTSEYKLYLANKKTLDITKKRNVYNLIHSFKPDIVIHLAAKTNVDQCQKNPKETLLINTEGTRNLVLACTNLNTTFIFISTAAVFDGRKKGFYENDNPNPLNIYGRSKFEAEGIIKK